MRLNEANTLHVGKEAGEMNDYSNFSAFPTPEAKECLWISRNLHHHVFSVAAFVITDIREMHNNKTAESFRLVSDLWRFLVQLACRVISVRSLCSGLHQVEI